MSRYYESISKVEQAKLVSAVKRLNERMRDLERQGLTDSSAYKNLSSWVASMPNKVDKTGHLRAVQTYKLSPSQARRTMAISKNKTATAGYEKAEARKTLKSIGIKTPTTEQIRKYANYRGNLHDFIVNHKEAYYGTELHEATKRSTNLTRQEEAEFYRLMENEIQSVEANKQNFNNWINKQQWD